MFPRLFAAVMYKEWPVELWNIPNKRLMHSVDMNFEFPTAVVSNTTVLPARSDKDVVFYFNDK